MLMAAVLLAMLAAGASAALRAQDEPVVQPDDITTPVPTTFPTPTPAAAVATPAPPQPMHVPEDRPNVYVVRPADTLFTVALETGLDLDDVPCAIAHDFTVDTPLVIGDVLSLPPANVACHRVQPGDALVSIAGIYLTSAEAIHQLPWNGLATTPLADVQLVPGTHLRIPVPLPENWLAANPVPQGVDFLTVMLNMPVNTSPFVVFAKGNAARHTTPTMGPVPSDWPYGSGRFAWPVYGWLSQSYRYDHRAIDLAAPAGTPITAADRGVVVRAGWNDQGYGRFVIVDHNIDYVSLYAHLDRILVQEGDVVGQGQVIGTVGSTGNSTGPHLHFEIRDFGRLINPLELLALN